MLGVGEDAAVDDDHSLTPRHQNESCEFVELERERGERSWVSISDKFIF